MELEKAFTLDLELRDGYRFSVEFPREGVPPLVTDESPPLGAGTGPTPAELLAAAVANCLSASALFCLRKARVDVRGMRTTVRTSLVRNERGRLRIGRMSVRIQPVVAPEDRERMGRCLGLFEDYCVVTESVRGGTEVDVEVEPTSP